MISPASLKLSLTRRSLGRFAQVVMPAYEIDPCHQLMIDRLEQLLSGKIKKLAIICPPRHGKTTLGNIIAPAFARGRNPTETVITVSYGSELSETFGRRVRNILSHPAFAEVFPNCKLSPGSAAAYRFTTTAGGEYNATGRGGPITGKGASLLILDDLVKDSSEANSDTVCRGIIEWLQHVCFTRLTPKGRVLAIATRWSERDPMGWILAQAGWTVLHLPALAEKADPLGREIGEALWPSHYPVEALEAVRADVGSRVFQCLYQGNVSASQGTIFRRDWFRHYQQPPEHFTRKIQSWDTAFKTGTTNDYSVCATFGESENGFYLLSLYRDKVEFPELKRKVAELADAWKPSEIYVEDKASGQSLIQELKLATSYPLIPVKIDRDKETRASAVTGYFEAQKVLFPEGAPWLADLEDELASFPGGLHDDCVDAISQALNRMRDAGGIFGVIERIKSYAKEIGSGLRNRFGELVNKAPKPVPVQAATSPTIATEAPKKKANDPCPNCKSTATNLMGDGFGGLVLYCNQCHAKDGSPPVEPLVVGDKCPVEGCESKLVMSGALRCQNHGQVAEPKGEPTNGMSFAQYNRRRNRFSLR